MTKKERQWSWTFDLCAFAVVFLFLLYVNPSLALVAAAVYLLVAF